MRFVGDAMFRIPVRSLINFSAIAAAVVFLASPSPAQDRIRDVPGQGKGLSINLVTSGYSFFQPATGDDSFSFLATATIFNRSRNDISIEVPSTVGPNNCIIFKVYNEEGDEVWSSSASTSQTSATITLARGDKWKNTVRVPLHTNGGVPLESGIYTLEASLAGSLAIGGSTSFKITDSPGTLPGSGVVDGIVWQRVPYGTSGENNFRLDPVAEAHVKILAAGSFDWEIYDRAALLKGPVPITWQGVTDGQGGFNASISPGEYIVIASKGPYYWIGLPAFLDGKPVGAPSPAFPYGSAKITLADGGIARPVVTMRQGKLSTNDVASIGQVTVQQHPSIPEYLLVDVTGTVPTEGWLGGTLMTQELTSDGWLVMDFKANRPTGAVAQVITPITTKIAIPALPEIIGVRVRSASNSVDASLVVPE